MLRAIFTLKKCLEKSLEMEFQLQKNMVIPHPKETETDFGWFWQIKKKTSGTLKKFLQLEKMCSLGNQAHGRNLLAEVASLGAGAKSANRWVIV